jgi:CheY-like chemotaxis protein
LKRIVAFLDDLFFTVKIADAAKRAGLVVSFVKTESALFEQLAKEPSVAILDLNCSAADPIALAARVKAESPSTPVIGFVSHVQTEVRKSAEQAGCDVVLARSVFSTRLPEVLQQYAA